MEIDTEQIIKKVKCHPLLWNVSLELYKNVSAREDAWLTVCRSLNENFDQLSNDKRKAISRKIQQRWRNARDAYVKTKAALKKPDGVKSKKIYRYYRMLAFLDGNIRSSLYGNQDIDQDSDQSDEQVILEATSESLDPLSDTAESMHSMPLPARSSNRDRNASHNQFENEVLSQIKELRQDMQDDDWAFFLSIMPMTKQLDPHRKLLFRTKVLNLLLELQQKIEPL